MVFMFRVFFFLFSLLHCLTSHPKFHGLKQQPFNVSHGSVGWLGLAGKFCSSPLVLYMVPDRWLSELEWFGASNVILGWPGFFAFHAFSKTLLLHEPYLFSPIGLSSRVTRFLCSGSGIPKCQKQKLSILSWCLDSSDLGHSSTTFNWLIQATGQSIFNVGNDYTVFMYEQSTKCFT